MCTRIEKMSRGRGGGNIRFLPLDVELVIVFIFYSIMATSDTTFTAGAAVTPSDTTQQLQNYWTTVLNEIKNLQPVSWTQ